MRIYDVSRTVYAGMDIWPGDPPVSMALVKSIERGDSSNLSLLSMGSHTGTHVDAPRHFIPGSPGVDCLAPDVLVGIDSLSVEEYRSKGYPTHQTLLAAGLVIIEGLDLRGVPAGDYELMCLPLKLKDADGAPARVFLRELA